MKYWRAPLMLGLLLVLVMATGCRGRGTRQTSWPGLRIADDVAYVANVDQLVALDTSSGDLLWFYPEEPDKEQIGFYAKPVVDKERNLLLAAGLNSRVVYALRLGDVPSDHPSLAWTFAGAKGQYVGAGVVVGDLFLIGNGDGSLYALHLAEGLSESERLAWTFDLPSDRVWATPVVVDDTVYVASLDHNVYAVSLADGALRWRQTLEGAVAGTPVVVGDTLWVGDFADSLYQLDLGSGEVLWTFKGQDWFWASPLLEGTTLFVTEVGGRVYALDALERVLLWTADIPDILHGKPALSPDGKYLFIAGYEHGTVYALDVETGKVNSDWWVPPSQTLGRLPGDLVTDDARLYTMPILVPERVQAFDLDTGKLVWTYPVVPQE